MKLLKGNITKKTAIFLEVVSIVVTVIIAGFVAPFASAYFNSLVNPKPDVYIAQERCAITPLWGTDFVAFKGMIKNKGSVQENSIIVRVDVSVPFRHLGNNLTSEEINIGPIRGGETLTISAPILAPSIDYLTHCSITITMRISGETKTWDTATFAESW